MCPVAHAVVPPRPPLSPGTHSPAAFPPAIASENWMLGDLLRGPGHQEHQEHPQIIFLGSSEAGEGLFSQPLLIMRPTLLPPPWESAGCPGACQPGDKPLKESTYLCICSAVRGGNRRLGVPHQVRVSGINLPVTGYRQRPECSTGYSQPPQRHLV